LTLVLAITAAALGAAYSAPVQATPEPWLISTQALLEPDGSGTVSVGTDGAWSWQACDEQILECSPFGTGEEIGTGNAAPGTIFVATDSETQEKARSPIWHGNAERSSSPGFTGEARANTVVRAVSATWSGGWSNDFDIPLLAACETAEGTGCTALTDWPFFEGCGKGSAFIDPAFTGYYLAVDDHLYGPGTKFAAYAIASPYERVTLEPGATSGVAVLGRIEPAAKPAESRCGPPPLQPTVTLNPPGTHTEPATPFFSGTTTGYEPVLVQVFEGPEATGAPVATATAGVESGKWASPELSTPLAHGTYTAVAGEQSTFGKAEGRSSPITFQVPESVKEYLEDREEAKPLFEITGVGPGAIIPPPANVQVEQEFWERMAREKLEREHAAPAANGGGAQPSPAHKSAPPRFYVLTHPKHEHCMAHFVKTHRFAIKREIHGHRVTEHLTVCLRAAHKR
jgi:hypothetical protein